MRPEPGAVVKVDARVPEVSCLCLPFVLGVLVFPGVWCPQGRREGPVFRQTQYTGPRPGHPEGTLPEASFYPLGPLSVPKPEPLGPPSDR